MVFALEIPVTTAGTDGAVLVTLINGQLRRMVQIPATAK